MSTQIFSKYRLAVLFVCETFEENGLYPRKIIIHAASPISFKYVLREACSSAVDPLLMGVHTGSPTK